jgi:Zn-dependent oligopeptidase
MTAYEPSDAERALAAKAETDKEVPPIVWLLTPAEIEESSNQIIEATKANLDAIAAVPLDKVTFENTIAKLMTPPNYKTNPQITACKFLQHCSTDPAIREAASKAGNEFSKSRVEGRMRKDVYARVKSFSLSSECQMLDTYKQHYVKAALEDFERAGLGLSEANNKELRVLLERDSAVCAEYGKNLATDSTKLFFTPDELKGCTQDFIKDRLGKDEEGKCTITLKYPDIIPIGQTCEIAETRKIVAEAREGPTAYKNNLELVTEGIQLRKQIATLLGYPSWAEYICTKRMSGSHQAVNDFLTKLQEKLEITGKQNYDTLLQFKKQNCEELGIDFDGVLNAWDTAFFNNILLKTKYGVDSERIKEYFQLDHVVETTLAIYQELLGLTFQELSKEDYWSWHEDVRCFKVKDTESGDRIGHFYLDLHPRNGTDIITMVVKYLVLKWQCLTVLLFILSLVFQESMDMQLYFTWSSIILIKELLTVCFVTCRHQQPISLVF